MNRSVRTFLAIAAFLLAALIAINNVVGQQTDLGAWWLPLLLVVVGLVLALLPDDWSWRGISHAEQDEADAAVKALQAPPAPVLLAAPELEPEAETVVVLPAPAVAPVAEAAPETIAPPPVAELDVEPAVEPAVEPSVVPAVEPEPVVIAPASAPELEAAVPDDLTRIEGIGLKMDAALKAAGITTFARLAETSEDELRAAIAAAGMRFAPSVGTWPQQASYAARGDWNGLAVFQSTLTSGRR